MTPSKRHDDAPLSVSEALSVSGASTDQDLVARFRSGDRTAAVAIIDAYGPRLHAMLRNLCHGDDDLAAEFTQEAFARAWEKLDSFAGASSFYTWLYRLARNRALDTLARKRPMAVDMRTSSATISDDTPSTALAKQEMKAAVHHALQQLPTDAREIILLRDFDGLDYEQLAEIFSVAIGTIKSRLSRARSALRETLAGRIVAEDLS